MARNWWNNRVSIRVEHTILRNVRVHRFLRSRRSQFSLLLSLSFPRNRAPPPPLSRSPSNPVAFTVAIPLRENQRWLPRQHSNVVPSLDLSSFLSTLDIPRGWGWGGRGWHRIVRRDYILEQVFFLRYFLRDYFLERNKKCRWKKLKLLPPARVHAL